MHFKTLPMAAAAAAVAIAGSASAAAPPGPPQASTGPLKPEARAHLEAAKLAAREDFPAALTYCQTLELGKKQFDVGTIDEIRAKGGVAGQEPGPAKIFDNMYYLGVRTANSYAIDTPEGFILVDALNDAREAATQIEGGMRKLGLDPARIKYIVITHAHIDHYGGAKYLQDKYKARVLMGEADWAALAAAPTTRRDGTPAAPPPTKDISITEGMKLPGGVTLHLTPGHTPGTATMLIPVTDKGQKHLVALHGGSSMPVGLAKTYADSNERFMRLALSAGADVPMSNHYENDLSILKVERMQQNPAAANPFVMGQDGVRRMFTAFIECARAREVQGL